jgi:hypothetical protein
MQSAWRCDTPTDAHSRMSSLHLAVALARPMAFVPPMVVPPMGVAPPPPVAPAQPTPSAQRATPAQASAAVPVLFGRRDSPFAGVWIPRRVSDDGSCREYVREADRVKRTPDGTFYFSSWNSREEARMRAMGMTHGFRPATLVSQEPPQGGYHELPDGVLWVRPRATMHVHLDRRGRVRDHAGCVYLEYFSMITVLGSLPLSCWFVYSTMSPVLQYDYGITSLHVHLDRRGRVRDHAHY